MADNDSGKSLATFMTSKAAEGGEKKAGGIFGENKTQKQLKENKEKAEEEKNKELEDAKKKSSATSNRYKANMVQAQGMQFLKMLPFIMFGIVIVMIIIFKGGDWVKFGLNTVFNQISGR